MEQSYRPGLEGVIAAETAISFLDVEGEEIVIRGYNLLDLAQQKTYVDVLHLLVFGTLPNEKERDQLEHTLAEEGKVPDPIWNILKELPPTMHAMDRLRTAVSALGGFDPDVEDTSLEASQRKGMRAIARIATIVSNLHHVREGTEPLLPEVGKSFAENMLRMITRGTPSAEEIRAFDQSLIVYSEHEMPNSTFAARVIASTMADMYGALTGGVASLKGYLHGGANEAVMIMLQEAKTADQMESYILEKLRSKARIMGFGHRVYMKKMDPRAQLMKETLKTLIDSGKAPVRAQTWYDMCVIGERVMQREKGLYPNLDYYAAPVYDALNIPVELYTPIFFASRTAGLVAHIIEQHANNRLFRPRVLYTGPRGLKPSSN